MNKDVHLPLLRLGAGCAIITVVTTFVVHVVSIPAETFEDRLLLSRNSTYFIRNLVVIIHCICVVVSMAAVAHARKDGPKASYLIWGSIGFLVFGILEICRMVMALVYANGLRSAYLKATDPDTQGSIRFALEVQWPLISETIFVLFILAFGIGSILMGFGIYRRGVPIDKILGTLLIFWGLQSFLAMGNDYLMLGLDRVISTLSITFQPGARLFIAFWLLRQHL